MIYNVLLFVCLFQDLISWLKQRSEKRRLRSSRTHLPLSPSIQPFSPFLFVLIVCLYIPLSPLSCAFLSGFVYKILLSYLFLLPCYVMLCVLVPCSYLQDYFESTVLSPYLVMTYAHSLVRAHLFVFLFSCVLCVLIVTSTSNLQEAIRFHSYNSNFK